MWVLVIVIGFMVIYMNIGGQCQWFEDVLFIFKEQSILVGGGFSIGIVGQVYCIVQFIVMLFVVEGEELVDRC